MNSVISLLKTLYYKNKFLLVVVVLFMAIIVISGCTGNATAPSGPVGGGCGG